MTNLHLTFFGCCLLSTTQDYVRCLRDGEAVSVSGTHLGHNLPNANGNRYCINLVSVAGKPEE